MIIILIILILFLLYFTQYTPLSECYNRVFPPILSDLNEIFYIAKTPLKPLKSSIKLFIKDKKLPDFFLYKPKYFSEVRDQGRCGSCWSFVICSMLSDDITTKIIKFGKNLSVEQLISCYPNANPCDGEAPEDVLIWLEKTQFKISIDNKYTQKKELCVQTETGITVQKNSVKSLCKYVKRESITNPTIEEDTIIKNNIYNMKMQLYTQGPFFGSISIYRDFLNFKGDSVYKKNSNDFIGGHAIEIIGWCNPGVDLRKGFEDGYWICKNSWGKKWAYSYDLPGHFAIKMGVNESGIESRSGCAETNVKYILDSSSIPAILVFDNYIDYITRNKY
jgi:hypothetical protein